MNGKVRASGVHASRQTLQGNGAPRRLLIVEDDPDQVELAKAILATSDESKSLDVETASSLAEALQRLEENEVDICLLDLTLPDANGPEALTVLRERHPRLFILLMTGMPLDSLDEEHLKLADGSIPKDDIFSSLGSSIFSVIKRDTHVSH